MNEADWLMTEAPIKLFRFVRTSLSTRKQRLLACGFSRLIWDVLTPEQRWVVETVERHADDPTRPDEYARAVDWATREVTAANLPESPADHTHDQAVTRVIQGLVCTPPDDGTQRAMDWVVSSFARRPTIVEKMATAQQVRRWECNLIREVVGNPFLERVIAGPEWVQRGGTVAGWMTRVGETARALALGIQTDQAFDRMPILADAIEEDGCTDSELLGHLRDPRSHVRGCWALDLVLGKT